MSDRILRRSPQQRKIIIPTLLWTLLVFISVFSFVTPIASFPDASQVSSPDGTVRRAGSSASLLSPRYSTSSRSESFHSLSATLPALPSSAISTTSDSLSLSPRRRLNSARLSVTVLQDVDVAELPAVDRRKLARQGGVPSGGDGFVPIPVFDLVASLECVSPDGTLVACGNYSERCDACLPGSFAPAENCTSCGPGMCEDRINCTVCEPGTHAPSANSTACKSCADGFVAPESNMTDCLACSAGKQSNALHTECEACDPGFFSPHNGSMCAACIPGSFSPSSGASRCSLCPAGTYQQFAGRTQCIPCVLGTFASADGLTSCTPCPSGYYCPDPKSAPSACPAGYMCPAASELPEPCGTLMSSHSKATSCSPSPAFYVTVVAVTLVGIIVLCAIAFFVWRFRRQPEVLVESKQRLIPEPLPGPVYGGY